MHSAMILLFSAGFLTLVAVQAQVLNDPTCLFNATHCACRQNPVAGTCLRKQSGSATEGTCSVDTCNAGGYSCDCLGDSICKRDTCSTWVTKDGSSPSSLPKGSTTACVIKNDATCLTKIEVPIEYKMVRFGDGSPYNAAGTMFNMSAMSDVDDFITSRYKMSDSWNDHETLRFRHITMRLYESPNTGVHMLCAIYNTYGTPNDGLGDLGVTATIKGVSGQDLAFVACDDKHECSRTPSSTLTATHKLYFPHSDGWCVKPIERDSGAISVKFSAVSGFEGISFQLSDGMDESYYFDSRTDGDVSYGMSGTVDGNGLVANGAVPELLFDLAGIQVPQ